MAQKLRTPAFKGKNYVSVIGKFQFAVSSGNTGRLSRQVVGSMLTYERLKQVYQLHFADDFVPGKQRKSAVQF